VLKQLFFLLISSVIGLGRLSLLITWSFIEINMLIIIPLLRFNYLFSPNSSLVLKYFLVQSIGSIILLIRLIFLFRFSDQKSLFLFLMGRGIVWKIGIPPFHFWLLNIIIDLEWLLFFIIASWQKLLPIYFLNQICFLRLDIFIVLALLTSVVGSMGESSIKKILILSSLFTGAWIFSAIRSVKIFWLILLAIYRAILGLFLVFIIKTPIDRVYTNNFYMVRLQKKLIFFTIFLSIAGLPPSTGFFIKFIVSGILLEFHKYGLLRRLVFRTVALIYIYMSIFFLRITFNSVNVKNFLSFQFSRKEIFLIPLIIIGPMIFLII